MDGREAGTSWTWGWIRTRADAAGHLEDRVRLELFRDTAMRPEGCVQTGRRRRLPSSNGDFRVFVLGKKAVLSLITTRESKAFLV